jgi:hypothetical protein
MITEAMVDNLEAWTKMQMDYVRQPMSDGGPGIVYITILALIEDWRKK